MMNKAVTVYFNWGQGGPDPESCFVVEAFGPGDDNHAVYVSDPGAESLDVPAHYRFLKASGPLIVDEARSMGAALLGRC